MVFLLIFTVEHQRAQYAAYAQQLYLDAQLHQSQQLLTGGMVYDSEDAHHYYITNPASLRNIDDHNGGITIVFDKSGYLQYAVWTRTENRGVADSFLPEDYSFPNQDEK